MKTVYLLVRPKKGYSAHQRVAKLLSGPLFSDLHQPLLSSGGVGGPNPNPFSKLKVVAGDMELPDLGLSAADREQLMAEVEVVVHSAASLTLDAHIQDALRWVLCACDCYQAEGLYRHTCASTRTLYSAACVSRHDVVAHYHWELQVASRVHVSRTLAAQLQPLTL